MLRIGTIFYLFFPASWYKTKLEREFRNLPCCIVVLPITLHNLEHICVHPKAKPRADEMVEAIRAYQAGTCGCVHHEPYRGGGENGDG